MREPGRFSGSRFDRSRLSASRMDGAPPSALPLVVVTGGTITPFNSGGVDYIEVLWAASGSFSVSSSITTWKRALAAGAGVGGRVPSNAQVPGGGGAGGLIDADPAGALAAGSYTVTIGPGAAANAVTGGGTNGTNSTFVGPGRNETAFGGGRGAGSGTGNTTGDSGGSGGGGRGINVGGILTPGNGVAGQGFPGGDGIATDTTADRASGGGGGAVSAGGAATAGVAGTAGAGKLLDWIASPRTVCAGAPGVLSTATGSTADQTWGNGSIGSIGGTAGKGGDGFMFLRFRADQAQVVMA